VCHANRKHFALAKRWHFSGLSRLPPS